ncbi:mandelate racemase/muconate lactonizing enzyme family protein [Sulfolobus tengchongensis]|uniref:Mandelate racemase/muconate lactonizing enzyme family protein n=1 Tax=Sulfolobus tengchongensis TaxID=207809 RepID=A0AAX4L1L4_9CREN
MKVDKITLLPASIPYIDDPMPEWVEQWGIQLFINVNVEDKEGLGEVLVAGSGVISAYIGIFNDLIIPFLEGKEIRSISEVYETLEKLLFSAGLCSITLGSISGIETALWHVYSKVINKPVHYLLGGKIRDTVPVYASFPRYKTLEDVVSAVEKAIKRGFKLIKLHQPPNMVIESLKKIKDTFGDQIKVAVDLNSPFDYASALKFLEEISRYDIEWVEEPIYPPNDYDTIKRLTKDFPIACGENEYTLHGFKKLLETGVLYIQPDIAKIGGISKFLKVIDLAEVYNIKIMPHLRPQRSAIALYHTLQVASARNNIIQVEFPLAEIPKDLFGVEFKIFNGMVNVPDDISIDKELLKNKYSLKDKKLRLLKFSDLTEKIL